MGERGKEKEGKMGREGEGGREGGRDTKKNRVIKTGTLWYVQIPHNRFNVCQGNILPHLVPTNTGQAA